MVCQFTFHYFKWKNGQRYKNTYLNMRYSCFLRQRQRFASGCQFAVMVTWVHFFPLLNQNMFVQMLPLPKHNQTKMKKSPDVNITLPNCICIYSLAKKCIVCEHDTNLLNIDMTFWIGYINYMHFSVYRKCNPVTDTFPAKKMLLTFICIEM